MYHNTIREVMDMFVDSTPGESTLHNRLTTDELENGVVTLVGYGWQRLAEYDEETNTVTIFTGHRASDSKTTARWLNKIHAVAEERGRNIDIDTGSPVDGPVPECVKYVNNYVGFREPRSKVEQAAVDTVIDSLRPIAA